MDNRYSNKEKLYSVIAINLMVVAVLICYISILNVGRNKIYALGIVISIAAFVYSVHFYIKLKQIKTIRILKETWGKEVKKKRDFNKIKKLYDNLKNEKEFFIDDQTWFDLDMDKVFSKIDRTYTTPGEQFLYYMLRKPSFNEEELKERGEKIKYLKDDSEIREKIQYYLNKLGMDRKGILLEFLEGELIYSRVLKISLDILSVMAFASVIYTAYKNPYKGMIFVFAMYFVNLYVHSKVKNNILGDTSCIRYMHRVLTAADNITSIKGIDKNLDEVNNLKEELVGCRKLMKKAKSLIMSNTNGVDIVVEYFNIFFLLETRSFFSTVKEIKKNKDSIKKIYMTLGKIDATLSIASYRENLGEYVEPHFTKGSKKLILQKVTHPLIDEAVDNTIDIDKNIIITGSNMSGKSTFLRTVGVNVLFAQTIYTCTCYAYEGDLFRILTSISVSDNITSGKSYYMGEAEALYRIINSTMEGEYPIFTLIDEIFRGTNPIERINASAEILDYLAKHNCVVLVATHDLEITTMVKDLYNNYYFTENVTEEGLNFDYKIKSGVTSTRNAVKILEYMGYPKEIISNINQRIENKLK